MGDSYLAEDVLQEVFLYVAKNFSKIHRENCHELAAYLVSCSRSRAYDMLHLSSWMTTLPMMLIGMTGILLVIGFLVLVVMALNCLAHRKVKRKNRISKPPGRICGSSRAVFFTGADGAAFCRIHPRASCRVVWKYSLGVMPYSFLKARKKWL